MTFLLRARKPAISRPAMAGRAFRLAPRLAITSLYQPKLFFLLRAGAGTVIMAVDIDKAVALRQLRL